MTNADVSVELPDSGKQNACALPLRWETLLLPVQSLSPFLCPSGQEDEWQQPGLEPNEKKRKKCCDRSPNNLSLPRELFELIYFHHPIHLYCFSEEFEFTKDTALVL